MRHPVQLEHIIAVQIYGKMEYAQDNVKVRNAIMIVVIVINYVIVIMICGLMINVMLNAIPLNAIGIFINVWKDLVSMIHVMLPMNTKMNLYTLITIIVILVMLYAIQHGLLIRGVIARAILPHAITIMECAMHVLLDHSCVQFDTC